VSVIAAKVDEKDVFLAKSVVHFSADALAVHAKCEVVHICAELTYPLPIGPR